jgi:hypothetical protein
MATLDYHADVAIDEFLLARIREDEAAANAAADGPWSIVHGRIWTGPEGPGGTELFRASGSRAWYPDAVHIVRNEPRRVLAECASKRALLDAVKAHADGEWEDDPIHHQVLAAMAAVYADHPDYEPAWSA